MEENRRVSLALDIVPRIVEMAGVAEFEGQMRRMRGLINDSTVAAGGSGAAGAAHRSGLLGAAGFASDIGIAGAAGLGAFGVIATREAIAVEGAANRIKAAHNLSKQDYAEYTRFINENSTRLLTDHQKLWEGIGQSVEHNWGVKGTEAVTAGAAKMAKVFNGDYSTTVKGVTGLLDGFKVKADQIPAALDSITAAMQRSGLGSQFLTTGAGRFLVQAQSIGASMPESLGLAAEIDKMGIGSRAVGAFGSLIQRLGKLQTTKGYGSIVNIGQYGIEGSLANLLGQKWQTPEKLQKELGGGLSLTLAQRIVAGGPQGASLGDTQGALNQKFLQYSKSEAASLDKLRLSVTNLEEAFGKGLIPVVQTATEELTPLIGGIEHLVEKNPQLAKQILQVAVAVGGASVAFKVLTGVFSPLIAGGKTAAAMMTRVETTVAETAAVATDTAPKLTLVETGIAGIGTASERASGLLVPMNAEMGTLATTTTGMDVKLGAEATGIQAIGTAAETSAGKLETMRGALFKMVPAFLAMGEAASIAESFLHAGNNPVSWLKTAVGYVADVETVFLQGPVGIALQKAGISIPTLRGIINQATNGWLNTNGGNVNVGGSGASGGYSGKSAIFTGGAAISPNAPASTYGIPTGSVYHPTQYLAGESQAYGFTATSEVNYGLGDKSYPFKAPPGRWRVTGIKDQRSIGIGLVLIIQNIDTGQSLAFLHLRRIDVKMGQVVHGGQRLGMTGWPTSSQWSGGAMPGQSDAHLAVVIGPTNKSAYKPSSGPLNLPFVEQPYGGAFTAAGAQQHVDPSVLAGIGMSESSGNIGSGSTATYGSMGAATATYGSNAGGQIGGAAQHLRSDLNDAHTYKTPANVAAAREVLRRLGVNHPTANQIDLVIGLAYYNAGRNGKYVNAFINPETGRIDGAGMGYALQVLGTSMKDNHGAFPATYYTGQGANRIPTGGGPVQQVPDPNPQPKEKGGWWGAGPAPTTPGGWSDAWGAAASNIDTAITNAFGPNIDITKLSPSERTLLRTWVIARAKDQYQQTKSFINQTVPGGVNSPAGRDLLREAQKRVNQVETHPFAGYSRSDPWLQHMTKALSNEQGQYSALSDKWSGVDPTTLGSGQRAQWLKDQYRKDNLWREIHDNIARIQYHAHHISKNTLDAKLNADKYHTNVMNQNARRKADGDLGPVGRVAAERVVSRCEAEARANVIRTKQQKAAEHGAKIAAEGLVVQRKTLAAIRDLKAGPHTGSKQSATGKQRAVGEHVVSSTMN